MNVILLERVVGLGKLGDKVKVKAGYGRNFLVPYGKAVPATQTNIASFEARRAELEKAAAEQLAAAQARADQLLAAAQARADQLEGKEFSMAVKAGDEGKLFGSIGVRDIADLVSASGVEIEKSEVLLPAGPIRNVGVYAVEIRVHSDVAATINLSIVAE